jgi:hypothetical protein
MPSAATLQTLDRHIERALRQCFGAGANLRHVVRVVVLEMASRGASGEAIDALLRRSVEEHPQRHRWDRVSIITGLAASIILTRQMLRWAEHPTPLSRAARRPSSGSRQPNTPRNAAL